MIIARTLHKHFIKNPAIMPNSPCSIALTGNGEHTADLILEIYDKISAAYFQNPSGTWNVRSSVVVCGFSNIIRCLSVLTFSFLTHFVNSRVDVFVFSSPFYVVISSLYLMHCYA